MASKFIVAQSAPSHQDASLNEELVHQTPLSGQSDASTQTSVTDTGTVNMGGELGSEEYNSFVHMSSLAVSTVAGLMNFGLIYSTMLFLYEVGLYSCDGHVIDPYQALILYTALSSYFYVQQFQRLKRRDNLMKRLGFSLLDSSTWKDMTVEEAQAIYRNLAQYEFPFMFEFGWIIEFFKTASAPVLSEVICRSGHFTNADVLLSHARQQDTVCLMTAMMAQKFHGAFHSLTMARINEHHNNWGSAINSDTVLWLSWMWMHGPIQWINQFGYRKLNDFEEHAMFIIWRELSVMLGCRWVPQTREEFEEFRVNYAERYQKFSAYNVTFSEAVMDAVIFSVPWFLKPIARKCVIAILDADVRRCNGYDPEFSPILRSVLFTGLQGMGWFQALYCHPRLIGRVLTPSTANDDGTVNFPSYTFPATPYYVRQTWWNQYGPIAILNRLRGLPIPSPQFGSNGVHWEAMGASRPTEEAQTNAEIRVREAANKLQHSQWGYRPAVKFQKKSLVVTVFDLPGYGNASNRYQPADCIGSTPN